MAQPQPTQPTAEPTAEPSPQPEPIDSITPPKRPRKGGTRANHVSVSSVYLPAGRDAEFTEFCDQRNLPRTRGLTQAVLTLLWLHRRAAEGFQLAAPDGTIAPFNLTPQTTQPPAAPTATPTAKEPTDAP